jgi:hypothetical protein
MTDGEIFISTAIMMIKGKDRDTAINFFCNLIKKLKSSENLEHLNQYLISEYKLFELISG